MTIALLSMVVALALEAGFRETSRPLLPGSTCASPSGAGRRGGSVATADSEGHLTGRSGAVLELEGDTEAFAIPLARVARLEISRGRKNHALNGARIGGARRSPSRPPS